MFISVDVEADGPCPGLFSMLSLGAVVVDGKFDRTFYTTFAPISDRYQFEALQVNGFTRDQCLHFNDPEDAMLSFFAWLQQINPKEERLFFVSDNPAFDWQFVNYYFWDYVGANPFGYSATNLGSLYKGMVKDMFKNFKHLRKTKHTHNALDDAMGNAEALWHMKTQMGLKAKL